jgi:hypothetical protein
MRPLCSPARDRITVELRGLRERLHVAASARRMTTAALTRQALIAWLGTEPVLGDESACDGIQMWDNTVVKLTLRLSNSHALALTTRARAADVSQGAYVAALIDGHPPVPRPRDHADALAAALACTDQLSVMCTDINALMRLLRSANQAGLQPYVERMRSLDVDVRRHLIVASSLMSELRATQRRPPAHQATSAAKQGPSNDQAAHR